MDAEHHATGLGTDEAELSRRSGHGVGHEGELAEAGTGNATRGVAKPVTIRIAESCRCRSRRRLEIPSRSGLLPPDGDVGASDPGAMSPRGRDREQPSALDTRQLPAALMDQPVVAVAEQDQVVHVGRTAVAPVHQVRRR